MRSLPLLLALTITFAAGANAQTMTGAASPIGERFCAPASELEGLRRCPGPAGIDAFVLEESGRPAISLGDPEGGFVGFAEAIGTLGSTMEWRLSDGRPFAGIVRFRMADEAGGSGDLLAIVKVSDGERPGCLVALVDLTVNPEGRDMARRLADDRASSFTCEADAARFYGMSSDWARALAIPALP